MRKVIFSIFILGVITQSAYGLNGTGSSLLSPKVLKFTWDYFDNLIMNVINFITCDGEKENLMVADFLKNLTNSSKTITLHKDSNQVGNLSSYNFDVENGFFTRIDCLLRYRTVLTAVSQST